MALKYCQGPCCHQYATKDRIKGTKGNKTFQTRRRSAFYYGQGNFCSLNCQNDWFETYGNQAIDHFGRTTEAQHLREDNAWVKDYDWRSSADDEHRYFYVNQVTKERRPLTEDQYRDSTYTLNERG
jgi:hypothetical protein|tara:strand:- start:292 stop:669 length:378 start_codon:yes stop_codon:yes gene_type:complete